MLLGFLLWGVSGEGIRSTVGTIEQPGEERGSSRFIEQEP